MATSPVLDAIRESLKEIHIIFEDTPDAFKGDKAQTAKSRETTVTGFLRSYLPSNWSVKKGPIYDTGGNVSREVDCAICIPEHPPCKTPNRDLILAEGVHVAVEVKPDITSLGLKSEIARSLEQCISVKALKREMVIVSGLKDYPTVVRKIPYAIFSGKIASLERTAEFVVKYKNENGLDAWQLPDIILGLNHGLIFHAPNVEFSLYMPYFQERGLTSGEAYWIVPAGDEALPLFLSMIYGFATPLPVIGRPILQEYLLPLELPCKTDVYKVTESSLEKV